MGSVMVKVQRQKQENISSRDLFWVGMMPVYFSGDEVYKRII